MTGAVCSAVFMICISRPIRILWQYGSPAGTMLVLPENIFAWKSSVLEKKVIAKFSIKGNLRFLSHKETFSVFQRAFIRAGINLRYSQGFNPRPKLSLPLPRTVGVECDEDLLCVGLADIEQGDNLNIEELQNNLSAQLPCGCKLLGVNAIETKKAHKAVSAVYIFPIQKVALSKQTKEAAEKLPSIDQLYIDRRTDAKGNTRRVNVAGFIESVKINSADIVVKCKISSAGTIRVDEISNLLELDGSMLTGPVRRTAVKWEC